MKKKSLPSRLILPECRGWLFKMLLSVQFACAFQLPTQSTEAEQQKKVVGVVRDAEGEPIIGANITVKGQTTGTITDIGGNFSIDAPVGSVLKYLL